jgi:hypothetical protein
MTIRSNGASVGSVVNAQRVIEAVWLNRSSCTMTAGRSFPVCQSERLPAHIDQTATQQLGMTLKVVNCLSQNPVA